ncbi:hypothetical protein ZHAS_00004683 [Anopheles sinensis]|uniref:Uncharacterized protein n=1 Tax=Anopheles sinensis TaxID=74873 RepID=A0A084VHE1_ANOSI|nr:hypothetical protein ZHAS_00004683 [Anopheles sinensis]
MNVTGPNGVGSLWKPPRAPWNRWHDFVRFSRHPSIPICTSTLWGHFLFSHDPKRWESLDEAGQGTALPQTTICSILETSSKTSKIINFRPSTRFNASADGSIFQLTEAGFPTDDSLRCDLLTSSLPDTTVALALDVRMFFPASVWPRVACSLLMFSAPMAPESCPVRCGVKAMRSTLNGCIASTVFGVVGWTGKGQDTAHTASIGTGRRFAAVEFAGMKLG